MNTPPTVDELLAVDREQWTQAARRFRQAQDILDEHGVRAADQIIVAFYAKCWVSGAMPLPPELSQLYERTANLYAVMTKNLNDET